MKKLLIIIALLLASAWCYFPMQPAQAASCPSPAASLIRVAYFWQDYQLAYFDSVHSQEFPALSTLPALYTGQMAAVYSERVNYWLRDDGKPYFATEQAYPYLIEYYIGKYDGVSECQLLIGVSPEYPDTAFVYMFTDYWTQLNDGDSAVHPMLGAYYMPLATLTKLLGAPK